MLVEFLCGGAFHYAKCVIYVSDPKTGLRVKCGDSCVFNVFHENVGNYRGNARTHGRTENLAKKNIVITENSGFETNF